jgi:hypothetical protein
VGGIAGGLWGDARTGLRAMRSTTCSATTITTEQPQSDNLILILQTNSIAMKKIILPLAITASLAALAIAAPDKGKPSLENQEAYQKELFKRIDANSDGKVTEREFAVMVLWDEFKKADTDSDGKVTKAEYAAIKDKKKDLWSKLDTKGKGHVTFEDCCKNPTIVAGLKDDWNELLSELGKKGVKHLTLADLPDLTP